MSNRQFTRRQFVQSVIGAGLAGSTLYGTLGTLAASRAMAAPADDYRALVCLFLLGGNDGFNMLVPSSASQYSEYAEARQNLALDQVSLLPINPLNDDGTDYGLHPSLPNVQSMFNSTSDAAFVANVGALVVPTDKNAFTNNTVPLPPNLFAHNSQQNYWQSLEAFGAQKIGWAGRLADVLSEANPGADLPLNISLSGANLLQVGINSTAFNTGADGAIDFQGFGWDTRRQAVEALYARSQEHVFKRAFASTMDRAILYSDTLSAALDATAEPATVFADNPLAARFRAVSHLIAARNELNMRRQVFFIGFGGWDTHDSHLERQATLLATVDSALASFREEMIRIGCHDAVTTFTASDFGRTLTSNGDGSDHGWGSHTLLMGGAVDGQKIHGDMPSLVIDGPQDTGRGRIIPTLSVDQYGATLARWFGVPESDLATIFPNLGEFDQSDLGFFA